ncbi:SDR family oxidoreductase [Fredinandcohnia humi]
MSENKRKILILGGKGYVGSNVMDQATKKNITFFGTSRSLDNDTNILQTDIYNHSSLLSVITKSNPDVIVWTLMSGENECELINSGLVNLLSIIKKETKLLFISTDAVFTEGIGDYKETDKIGTLPNDAPLSVYVNAKYKGEYLIKENHSNHIIIRTGPIYGSSSNTCIEKRTTRIIEQIKENKNIQAATNLYRTFIHVNDLSNAIIELIEKDFSGTIHLGPMQKISYYTFYKRRLEQLGINTPITSYEITKEESIVSLDTSLNTQKANELLKTNFRTI